jgi:guanylate kinase
MPDAVTIFILPPSVAELERRLRGRGTDSESVIRRRLDDAMSDMERWSEFDHVIFNDDLDRALADLEDVFAGHGERSSTSTPKLRAAVEEMLANS